MSVRPSKSFYIIPKKTKEIEQGDIFSTLPFLKLTSTKITEFTEQENKIGYLEKEISEMVIDSAVPKNVLAKAEFKPGIIITQNCDMYRDDFVSFCEIDKYELIDKNFNAGLSTKKIADYLVRDKTENAKFYYLPEDESINFNTKMGVKFASIFQIHKDILTKLTINRVATLNSDAMEHFRQKLSNYFRRYAYNGWYPLNRDEFNEYKNNIKDPKEKEAIIPYNWHV